MPLRTRCEAAIFGLQAAALKKPVQAFQRESIFQ